MHAILKIVQACVLMSFIFVPCLVQGQEQNKAHQIKGVVFDQNAEQMLQDVEIELLNVSPLKLCRSNENGQFNLEDIPAGRHRLLVRLAGYEEVIVPDIVVSSGQNTFLKIGLEELKKQEEKVVKNEKKTPKIGLMTKTTKDKPNNQMAGIAARPFTIEEVTRYAGARFDPARMVTNYAGAAGYDDSRNDIVVRGNSPSHILWQIEELPVENPNHVSTIGTSGGITPILNVFALGQSDFLNGSFAAQYGNAIGGVFDLKLRNGNNERFSGMGQLGTQRAELLLEGPLSKNDNSGSFLLSLRSSSGYYLLKNLIPSDPAHQDFNLKINFGRQKWGELDIFAIGGYSNVWMPYQQNTHPSSKNLFLVNFQDIAFYNKVRYDIYEFEDYRHRTMMGLAGLKYTAYLSRKTFWRTVLGASHHGNKVRWDINEEDSLGQVIDKRPSYTVDDSRNNYMLHSYIQSKINRNLTVKGGVLANVYQLSLLEISQLDNLFDYDYKGLFTLSQAYVQMKYHLSNNFALHLGVHGQYSSLNKQAVAEPRVAFNWEFVPGHTFSGGYGFHNQMVPYVTLFFQPLIGVDSFYDGHHRDLKFISSHHLDASYDWIISSDWRFRLAGYMQWLNNVPVDINSSYYSELNNGAAFYDAYRGMLQSNGKGKNMGLELTLEKFFSNGYYGLLSGSLYDSESQGSNGVWRNTIFNTQFMATLLVGREFPFGKEKQHVFFADLRAAMMGGKPYTPIDTLASYLSGGEEIYLEARSNMERLRNFYQVDLKIGIRINTAKLTHSIKIDLFNVLNIQNPLTVRYSERFNPLGQSAQGHQQVIYQRGFIPDIVYTIQF